MSVIFQINVDPDYLVNVQERLKDSYDIKDIKMVDVGFGIKAIQALFILDEDQSVEDIEYNLSEIEGVSSVQIISMNRLG